MARPSVKNTTLLRPGMAFIALTTAISALAVAKPCSSRSSDWNVSAIRRWMVANCASAAAPPMSDDAPPWPAPPVMLLSALLALISSAADRFTCSRVVLKVDVVRPAGGADGGPDRVGVAGELLVEDQRQVDAEDGDDVVRDLALADVLVGGGEGKGAAVGGQAIEHQRQHLRRLLRGFADRLAGSAGDGRRRAGRRDRRLADRGQRAEILGDAVLEDLEVVGGQTLDRVALLVAHHDVDHDGGDVGRLGLDGTLRGRLLGRERRPGGAEQDDSREAKKGSAHVSVSRDYGCPEAPRAECRRSTRCRCGPRGTTCPAGGTPAAPFRRRPSCRRDGRPWRARSA